MGLKRRAGGRPIGNTAPHPSPCDRFPGGRGANTRNYESAGSKRPRTQTGARPHPAGHPIPTGQRWVGATPRPPPIRPGPETIRETLSHRTATVLKRDGPETTRPGVFRPRALQRRNDFLPGERQQRRSRCRLRPNYASATGGATSSQVITWVSIDTTCRVFAPEGTCRS